MLRESGKDSKTFQEFKVIFAPKLGAADDEEFAARPEMQRRMEQHLKKTAKSAREQRKQAIDIGQEKTAQVDGAMKILGTGMETVLHFNDLIDTAVEAPETASMVFSAIKLGLNLFVVSKGAPEKRCAGIVYMMEHLSWYHSLSHVVLKKYAATSMNCDLRASMEERIFELNKIIISLLTPAVCRNFRSQLT